MKRCTDCEKIISKGSIRCQQCNGIHRRSFATRQEYARNWHLLKKYKIDSKEFDAYWIVCRGKCFICEKTMKIPSLTRGQGLDVVAVDHDHITNEVWGLLCNACNKGLGFFQDRIDILEKTIHRLNLWVVLSYFYNREK